ncbi:MAG: class II SORL domain-containing protein [Candidatus Thermoplasmatota archaeon]|jgi:superoxide reductase|nr:class II SORL domain-containing protein [Candidatus Thermoplasmatota archaeon]
MMKVCDIYKGAASEGKEKHVPQIEVHKGEGKGGKDIVKIVVGKDVPHPNLVEHHIVWAQLMGVKANGLVIDLGKVNFAPAYTEPSACFHVPLGDFKSLIATSYCNIHGVWESSVDL